MNLSINFTLEELIESEYAHRNGIDEQFHPSDEIKENLGLLCKNVLQPLRDYLKKSITVTCGYRCPKVNTGVGGSKTSEHMKGMASDIKYIIDGICYNKTLFKAIIDLNLPFNQLIYEFGDDNNPAWVHVSFNKTQCKREILRAKKVDGKTVYIPYHL